MATITEIQDKALNFADESAANIERMELRVNTLFTGSSVDRTEFTGDEIATPVLTPEPPDDYILPALIGAEPTRFAMRDIVLPTLGGAPEFNQSAPSLSMPSAPSIKVANTLPNAPEFLSPKIPDAPVLTLPKAPTLSAVQLPTMPALVMPQFQSTLPLNDITAPTETFKFAEVEYKSTALDAVKSKLLTALEEGGYGINSGDEARLWERGREREMRAAETKIQGATRQMATRGFSMPAGALNALISEAQQSAHVAISGLSREIMLKRADLYLENYKFTIEQVKDIEKTLINYHGAMMERALNASRALVELAIAGYNARVANFNLKLESYKASAQVYESMIRAAGLQLQAYKDQLEGVRISVDVQRLYVDTYKTQIDAQQSLIGIYTARVGATRLLVEVEQAKLAAYRSGIEAYSAQVSSQGQLVQLYEAQIRGETAKVNAYGIAAQAYGSTVQAYSAKANVADSAARTQIAGAQLQLEAYKTDIDRYTMELTKSNTMINQSVAQHEAELRKYSVTSGLVVKQADMALETAKLNADLKLRVAENKSRESIADAQVLTQGYIARAGLYGNMAGTYGSFGAAAVSSAVGIITAVSAP
jgi:hypothetical protein